MHPGCALATPRRGPPEMLCSLSGRLRAPSGLAPCFLSLFGLHTTQPTRQRVPETQDKKQPLGGGACCGPPSSIGDLAESEHAIRPGTGVSFMLCPRAGETLVIKCHIRWGSPAQRSWRAGFVRALFSHLTPASWSALF